MEYSLNHSWKFYNWPRAYRVGLLQMLVVLTLEFINLSFMLTNGTISDIIKDFLALLIISDFDNYFFMTVDSTPTGRLIKDGEIETSNGTL